MEEIKNNTPNENAIWNWILGILGSAWALFTSWMIILQNKSNKLNEAVIQMKSYNQTVKEYIDKNEDRLMVIDKELKILHSEINSMKLEYKDDFNSIKEHIRQEYDRVYLCIREAKILHNEMVLYNKELIQENSKAKLVIEELKEQHEEQHKMIVDYVEKFGGKNVLKKSKEA